jgi:hypothetical protein
LDLKCCESLWFEKKIAVDRFGLKRKLLGSLCLKRKLLGSDRFGLKRKLLGSDRFGLKRKFAQIAFV